jgi:hypothetical protein
MTISESHKEIEKRGVVFKRGSVTELGEHRRNTSKLGAKTD